MTRIPWPAGHVQRFAARRNLAKSRMAVRGAYEKERWITKFHADRNRALALPRSEGRHSNRTTVVLLHL